MIKDKKVLSIAILSVFIVILVGVFIAKPAITGYTTYKEMQKSDLPLEEYKNKLTDLKGEIEKKTVNLTVCANVNEKLLTRIENLAGNLSICNEDLAQCNLNSEEQINNLTEQYKLLIENTANRICCKAKVDNPNIKYYAIKDNQIICLEEGDKEINCDF